MTMARAVLALAILFAVPPAYAMQAHPPQALQPSTLSGPAAWPALVEASHAEPASEGLSIFDTDGAAPARKPAPRDDLRGALAATDHLLSLCAANPDISANLRSLSAELRMATGDFAGAAALVAPMSPDPSAPLLRRNMLLLLRAGLKNGDVGHFAAIRSQVSVAHDRLMRLKMGVETPQRIDTKIGVADAYLSKSQSIRAAFIVWPIAGGPPMGLFVRNPVSGDDWRVGLVDCSGSTSLDYPTLGSGGASDQELIDFARRIFSDSARMHSFWSPGSTDCLNAGEVLPAFGNSLLFIGNEYSDHKVPTERQLQLMLDGSDEQSDAAVHYAENHPESVNPMMMPFIISKMMRRGNMMHAAFWYYFWQIRSAPWAKFGPPDGYPAVRGAISATLGSVINKWAGSDIDAMRDLITRASSFERRTPLYRGKPDGVSDVAWESAVSHSRVEHDPKLFDSIFPRDAASRRKYLDQRKVNGLYVGPLRDIGEPLPADWR